MSDHQPNHSEFSPLAAVVPSCLHPDSVSVGLRSDCRPCGQIAPNGSICIAGHQWEFPQLSTLSWVFPMASTFIEICHSLPSISARIAQHHPCPMPWLGSAWISVFIPGAEADWNILAFILRAFRDRGRNGLNAHSPRICCTSFIDFQGSTCLGRTPSLDQTSLQAAIIWSIRKCALWILLSTM